MPVSKFTPKPTTTVKKPVPSAKATGRKIVWQDPDEAFKKHKLSVEIVGEQGLGKTSLEELFFFALVHSFSLSAPLLR